MYTVVTGVVIRAVAVRDHDVMITLFTREKGKVGVAVRGARKQHHKYGAIAHVYAYGTFTLRTSGTVYALVHGELVQRWRTLTDDVWLLAYVATLIEQVDQLVADGDVLPVLFDQLIQAMAALDAGCDAAVICSLCTLHMLTYTGFSPSMHACVCCGASDDAAWSVRAGGVVCRACAPKVADAHAIAPSRIRLLRTMVRTPIASIGHIRLSAQTIRWLQRMLWQWLDVHTSMHARARAVLVQLLAIDEQPRGNERS
jgi:DNA repair protein RecO (recombination protein O)